MRDHNHTFDPILTFSVNVDYQKDPHDYENDYQDHKTIILLIPRYQC